MQVDPKAEKFMFSEQALLLSLTIKAPADDALTVNKRLKLKRLVFSTGSAQNP